MSYKIGSFHVEKLSTDPEVKRKQYAVYKLKYGYFYVEEEDERITCFRYLSDKPENMGNPTLLTDLAAKQMQEYFEGTRRQFDFKYRLCGTDFQKKVWAELEKIPYGETRSYKEIAVAVGNSKACRAVGAAVHCNPVIVAVPCHRVIGSDGKLTGYAAGLKLKKELLELEKNGALPEK